MCFVEQFIEQLVEQAEKLTNNGNASPVGQESSAPADESSENIQSSSDKGAHKHFTTFVMITLYTESGDDETNGDNGVKELPKQQKVYKLLYTLYI